MSPHRLMYLNSWSLAGEDILEGCGTSGGRPSLAEAGCLEKALSFIAWTHFLFAFYFLTADMM